KHITAKTRHSYLISVQFGGFNLLPPLYACAPPTRVGRFAVRPEVVESIVVVDGLRLFVREHGDGYPLLLVNGLGAHCDLWGEAERILGRTSRTIVFDCPGTGRSDLPLLPLSIPALARVACRILDARGY